MMRQYCRVIAYGLLLSTAIGRSNASAAPLDPTLPLFTSQSQGDVSLSSGNYAFVLGTDAPSLVFFNGPVFTTIATGFVYNGINVFDFHSLDIASGASISVLQSSASGPIALLSSTSLNVGGSIDVSGGFGVGTTGAGGGPGASNVAIGGAGQITNSPGGAGPGGVVVSGGGGGGFGGSGTPGSSSPIFNLITHVQVGTLAGGAGGSVYESLADRLQGGSAGGYGGGAFGGSLLPGAFGFGGGAIELGAVQTVSVTGIIKANGGAPGTSPTQGVGGGGGGSGGGVLIHGDSVDLSGTISAVGGAGGSTYNLYGSGGAGGGGLVLAEYNGPTGHFSNTGTVNVGNGRFDAISVPEPSSLALLGISALGGLAATGWRRRSLRG